MTTPIEADMERARGLLPCLCKVEFHYATCPAYYRSPIAAALAEEREKALDRLARAESVIAKIAQIARTYRKPERLVGPAEYAHVRSEMRVWRKAVYGVSREISAALADAKKELGE